VVSATGFYSSRSPNNPASLYQPSSSLSPFFISLSAASKTFPSYFTPDFLPFTFLSKNHHFLIPSLSTSHLSLTPTSHLSHPRFRSPSSFLQHPFLTSISFCISSNLMDCRSRFTTGLFLIFLACKHIK